MGASAPLKTLNLVTTMAIKIDKKIVSYSVQDKEQAAIDEAAAKDANIIHMHETVERPEVLVGSTYKLKTPEHVSAHAMYITINDIVLNEGTEHELRRPFEVFINSKNMDHFQWIVALTRIMSAVFRKGGDVTFLVEELHSVFDPRGGYWNKGRFVPSLISEIGDVIETHLIKIGMLKSNEPDEHQKALIEKKKAELAAKEVESAEESETLDFPETAELCSKCNHKAVVMMDGCMTCLNCGDSKCG